MEYRNPQYNADGTIDCEINHPSLGWIPFTASPQDPEAFGRDLFAEIEADGGIAANVAPPPVFTVEDVIAERKRRLALGFDYDFGDARGIHNFATTEQDMEGWREVSMWADAEAGLGNTGATQDILTETGAVTVSVSEWFLILRAATAYRQPIWQASFVLQANNPIPDPATWAGWP